MPIRHRQTIFTIGREPFVAGTIVIRNGLRTRKRDQRRLRWNALKNSLRLFRRKYSMQPKRSLIYILAGLISLPLFGTVATATTIDIIQTFDYPGGIATLPQKIEDQTDLVGTFITPDG